MTLNGKYEGPITPPVPLTVGGFIQSVRHTDPGAELWVDVGNGLQKVKDFYFIGSRFQPVISLANSGNRKVVLEL